jgi:hypothetical protein
MWEYSVPGGMVVFGFQMGCGRAVPKRFLEGSLVAKVSLSGQPGARSAPAGQKKFSGGLLTAWFPAANAARRDCWIFATHSPPDGFRNGADNRSRLLIICCSWLVISAIAP